MKRSLSLLFAIVLIVALFAACGGSNNNAQTTTAPPVSSPTGGVSPSATATTSAEPSATLPADDTPGYNYAPGKYEVGADGIAAAYYDYTLPLTTNNDTFTYWTVCYTSHYLAEDGLGAMPFQVAMKENTGVNIDYIVLGPETRKENFAVLLASDDLPDMLGHGLTYYGKSARNAIDEGWFVNLYEYKDYMPNYLKAVKDANDFRTKTTVYYDPETIVWFYGLVTDPTPAQGYCARNDWLTTLGLTASEIDTFDEVHDMLTRFKNEIGAEFPMEVFNTIELVPTVAFAGYNTAAFVSETGLPLQRVVDGKLVFTLTQQDDLDLITMASQWYAEGLIDPSWPSYRGNQEMGPAVTTGKTGYVPMNPSQAVDFEVMIDDPNAEYIALPRTLKTEGQVLEYGQKLSPLSFGTLSISTKCENIPLAVTYWDYFYSPEGALFANWGVEGVTYEVDANGNRMLSDFMINNPSDFSTAWLLQIYTAGNLIDPFLFTQTRSYAYPGGDRLYSMFQTWIPDEYSGSYDLPGLLSLTDEETQEINKYSGDVVTYISEHYLAFFDGSKPLSEWDDYVSGLSGIGMNEILTVYQGAYSRLLEKVAAEG